MKHSLGIVFLVAIVSGCAMSSGVLKTGPDTYTIAVHAAPVRGGIAGAKKIAYTKANAQCESEGKQILTVSEETGHDFPAAGRDELTFRCIPKDAAAVSGASNQ
jgi:hypothetical protein